MKKHLILIGCAASLFSANLSASFWEEDVWTQRDRGFLWYPDEREKASPPPDPDLRLFATVPELKEERTRRLERAIMDPSPENMASYLEANHYVQEKSALFTDVYRRALWENPQYDYSVKNPAANFAQVKLAEERKENRYAGMAEIAKDWGLVYFLSSSCRFCSLQSPLVKELAEGFGFEILPVSSDGVPTADFPDALPDNGISMLLTNGKGLPQVPALFIVNREGTKSFPVSSGVLSIEDMIKRIEILVNIPEGASLFGGADAK